MIEEQKICKVAYQEILSYRCNLVLNLPQETRPKMKKQVTTRGRCHLLLKAHVQGRRLRVKLSPRRGDVDVWAGCVPAQAARRPVVRTASAAEASLPADR